MIPTDRVAKRTVHRSCLDRRAPPLPPYPGLKPSTSTAIDAARENYVRVWAALGSDSRFSDGNWPVLYTAPHRVTTYVEVGYHLHQSMGHFVQAGQRVRSPYLCYLLDLRGVQRDLTKQPNMQMMCGSGQASLGHCQQLAKQAMAQNVAYLKVPSARRIGKDCIPVLKRGASSPPVAVETFELELELSPDFIRVRKGGQQRRYKVDDVYP